MDYASPKDVRDRFAGLNSRATSTCSPGRASLFSLPMAQSQSPIVVFPAWPHVSLCRRVVQDMIGAQKISKVGGSGDKSGEE
jgi:hypothetical protein